MLGLNRKESRVFRFSLVGHGFVALVCAVFGFLPSCDEEEEKVHVFELASASPFPTIPAPQPPTPPRVVEPKPTPPQPPTPPKVVKPKPAPPKVVKPKPKPKPTPPKVVKPKPKPQPPKTVSFSQFKQDHKLPDPPTRKPKPAPTKPVPRIDGSKYTLPAPKLGTPSRSSVPQSVLDAYLSQVQAKMDRVWKRLQSSTDLGFGGEARLSFRISSNGTILSARLSKHSGNKALDDLVLRVSRTVGKVGPPPGGKLDSALEIPFVVN
jgi:periplasmic protein TonB